MEVHEMKHLRRKVPGYLTCPRFGAWRSVSKNLAMRHDRRTILETSSGVDGSTTQVAFCWLDTELWLMADTYVSEPCETVIS